MYCEIVLLGIERWLRHKDSYIASLKTELGPLNPYKDRMSFLFHGGTCTHRSTSGTYVVVVVAAVVDDFKTH